MDDDFGYDGGDGGFDDFSDSGMDFVGGEQMSFDDLETDSFEIEDSMEIDDVQYEQMSFDDLEIDNMEIDDFEDDSFDLNDSDSFDDVQDEQFSLEEMDFTDNIENDMEISEDIPELNDVGDDDLFDEDAPELPGLDEMDEEELFDEDAPELPGLDEMDEEELFDEDAPELPGLDEMDEAEPEIPDEIPDELPEETESSAMQDMAEYMSSHNYGREDYAEYSRDPEYQAINDRLLAEDGLDPVDYNEGRDYMAEMTEYMSEHNYGMDDYAEYSQDPQYQEINNGLLAAEGIEPPDYNEGRDYQAEMTEYMSEHNYGMDDYAEYSQDPEYQEINNGLLAAEGIEPPDYEALASENNAEEFPAEGEFTEDFNDFPSEELNDTPNEFTETPEDEIIEVTDNFGDEIKEPELPDEYDDTPDDNVFDLDGDDQIDTGEETPDINADDIWDENSDLNDDEMYDPDDITPEVTEENDISSDDVTDETDDVTDDVDDEVESDNHVEDTKDIEETETDSEIIEAEDVTDDITEEETEIPGDFSHIFGKDEFEDIVKLDKPDFYESGNFYEQGINEFGFEGTCGPTSQANAINTLLGTNEFTENKVLSVAVENDICETGSLDPADNGGTTTDQFMELYDKMNEKLDGRLNVERFDYDNALSVEQMAEKLDEGAVLNIAVDADTLWDQNFHIPGELGQDKCTDHWITVTGVDRNADGSIAGFSIIDSGGGETYADVEKYERMCFGEPGREMIDPTCIAVSKNPEFAEPSNEIPTEAISGGRLPGASDVVYVSPTDSQRIIRRPTTGRYT